MDSKCICTSASKYQANWFLCQQTENYEQRIREQQEQLSLQQTIIDKLKSQLLLVNSSQGMFILIFYVLLEPLGEKKVEVKFFFFISPSFLNSSDF